MLQTKEALQWSLRGFAISVINKTPIRILGIDPGLQRTGYGVIEQVGMTLRYLDSGTIIVPTQLSLAERLHTIFSSLQTVIQKNEPTIAAVEIVFFNTNAASSLLLGHARGAALCALAQAQLPVHEYTALQIKKSVVGHGKASKNQVQYMVQHLLSLNGIPSSDSADALACSICHANTSPLQAYLQQHRQTASTTAGKSRMRGGRFVR